MPILINARLHGILMAEKEWNWKNYDCPGLKSTNYNEFKNSSGIPAFIRATKGPAMEIFPLSVFTNSFKMGGI